MAKRKLSGTIDLTGDTDEEQGSHDEYGDEPLNYGRLQGHSKITKQGVEPTSKDRIPKPHTSTQSPAVANGVPIVPAEGDASSRSKYFRASARIVQPIVARVIARTHYDCRTIAHDVLVATGCHPTEPALNAHLQILKERFKNVDDTSDLSTLRWDLVEQDSPGLRNSRDLTHVYEGQSADTRFVAVPQRANNKRSELATSIGAAAGTNRVAYLPMSLPSAQHSLSSSSFGFTSTRPNNTFSVEAATLNRPLARGAIEAPEDSDDPLSAMFPVFGHPGNLTREIPPHKIPQPARGTLSSSGHGNQGLAKPTRGDLSSMGGSLYGPHSQTPISGHFPRGHKSITPSLLRDSTISDVSSHGSPAVKSPGPQVRFPLRENLSESSPGSQKKLRFIPGGPGGGGRYVESSGAEMPVRRREGLEEIRAQFHGHMSEASTPGNTPRRGRPPKSGIPPNRFYSTPKRRMSPQSGSATPSDSRSFEPKERSIGGDMISLPQKKRGRPFKTAEAAVAAAARIHLDATDLTPKRRPGRPAKGTSDLVFLPPPNPIFHPFLCEWMGCKAELHNFDTMRKHLFTVHCKKIHPGRYTCLWANCKTPRKDVVDSTIQEESNALSSFECRTRKELQKHVEEAHLILLAWHMGDGPQSTSLAASKTSGLRITSPWLFDATGKQVTPSVETIPAEPGDPNDNNSRRFMKKREGVHLLLVPLAQEHQKNHSNGNIS